MYSHERTAVVSNYCANACMTHSLMHGDSLTDTWSPRANVEFMLEVAKLENYFPENMRVGRV